jgi:hypothetical protein
VALVELATEYPELRAKWNLGVDGYLMGHLSVDGDGRAEMQRFVEVFGGEPMESVSAATSGDGDLVWSSWLWTKWRDVELSLTVSCPALLAGTAGPTVALPVAWSGQVAA